MAANFVTAETVFGLWQERLLTGVPPILFPVSEIAPLSSLEFGPGLINLFGGAPGSGKTALVMQLVVDALRLTEHLKVVVSNVEMSANVLMDRQLSRISGIPLNLIRGRQLGEEHAERLSTGFSVIEQFADRLCFVRPPFDLTNIANSVDEFRGGTGTDNVLLVLDYIQRITPPGDQGSRRTTVDATMNYLREFADAGVAVVVVSSVGRQKDNNGRSSYAGSVMNLASYKESGELEFGADDAFILTQSPRNNSIVELKNLKARYRDTQDVRMRFDGALQRFEPISTTASQRQNLSALWEQTPAAGGE